MLRKLVVLVLIAAVVGLGVFWFVTIPATVPASALRQRTPNLDNGKTMFLIGGCASCHATPEQDDKTRLGGGVGAEIAVRHLLRAEHLARSERRHRQMERGRFRHRDGRRAPRPTASIYFRRFRTPSYQHMKHRRRARPVRLSQDAAGGAGRQVQATTTCRFRSTSAARSAAGNSCSSTASRSSPIRPRTRRGIAAPIWSTAPAIAPNATRRATCSAASSQSQRFAGGPEPGRRGLGAQHHAEGLERCREEDIVKLLATGETPDGDSVGGEMGKVVAQHRASSARRIAPRSRPTSSRCRRSKGRSRRNEVAAASVDAPRKLSIVSRALR